MHICLKCARVAKTVDEIENGCPCGSKVFVYKRDDMDSKKLEPIKSAQNDERAHDCKKIVEPEQSDEEPGHEYCEVWLSKGAQVEKLVSDADSKEPKIENIRQIRHGVFEVDLLGLKNGPLVIRDREGVYYVRLPFEQSDDIDTV